MIEVAGKSTTAVIRRLHIRTELYSTHTTIGTWDLIVEIRADSPTDFDRALGEVRTIDGLPNSETSILLSFV
ncbi:Lrp/AsnC ligand binding domain-containing protein [Bradyrhizobium sp. Bra78]|uniref:Lrp/AsnC ligand binding domain-containing protein n=1 Tax=Bradyrhizobium sp. Bra78 TaxID=2926010 RepID=UPI003967C76D